MPGSRLHGREGWRPAASVPVLGQAASVAPALPSFPDPVAQSLSLLRPAALTLVGAQGCHDTAGPRRRERGERQERVVNASRGWWHQGDLPQLPGARAGSSPPKGPLFRMSTSMTFS